MTRLNFLWKRERFSLLGEMGAGKTTLMKILFGLYQPDGGSIKINGNEIKHQTAVKAFEMGLGMVHQHFMFDRQYDSMGKHCSGSERETL